jgi:hypothetical protein
MLINPIVTLFYPKFIIPFIPPTGRGWQRNFIHRILGKIF